jgi:dienelactone hydrolase
MKIFLSIICLLFISSCAHGTRSQQYLYTHNDQVLEGELFLPAGDDKRPAVLVYHAWKGPNEHTARVAKDLSDQGYIAFVADIYGQGVRPETTEQASERATFFRSNRSLLRTRARSALTELQNHPRVDTSNISAIGFCFGGGTVLEMARDGAPLRNVVSFHGNLDTPNIADAKNITSRVLVLHGAIDPYVPKAQLDRFHEEMDKARVNYTVVSFGGAVHSFTDPNAGNDPSKGVAYHEMASQKSFDMMYLWLKD